MRNYYLFTLVLISCLSIPLIVHGDSIPTTGEWGGTVIRTLPPAAPSASIEGDVLSLYFPSALSNLTVTVSDADGCVVYQTSVSSGSGYTYSIPLGLSPGEYQVTLTHSYGTLSGYFNI